MNEFLKDTAPWYGRKKHTFESLLGLLASVSPSMYGRGGCGCLGGGGGGGVGAGADAVAATCPTPLCTWCHTGLCVGPARRLFLPRRVARLPPMYAT